MSSNYMVIFRSYLLRKRFEELGPTSHESELHTPLSMVASSHAHRVPEHFMGSCCLDHRFLRRAANCYQGKSRLLSSDQEGGLFIHEPNFA